MTTAHREPASSRESKDQPTEGRLWDRRPLLVRSRPGGQALRQSGDQSLRPWCHGIVAVMRYNGRLKEQVYEAHSGDHWRSSVQ